MWSIVAFYFGKRLTIMDYLKKNPSTKQSNNNYKWILKLVLLN